jgi:dihydrolipoamide dehydrogenase
MTEHYKVAIIGGGPGGYETAIRLHQFGISVVCIEKDRLGGVCLNRGCIPTKSLVKTAELYHEMRHADEFGLEKVEFPINYQKIFDRKKQIVDKLVGGIEFLFTKRQIPLLKYKVSKIEKVQDIFHLFADTEPICSSDYIIVATGSEPRELPFLQFDGVSILSSDHILDMIEHPSSLAIIGGGVIGCEFACIYHQLGVEVTIIEYLPEIIPTEDDEIAKRLSMALKRSGIKILTKTAVESGRRTENDLVELKLSNGKTVECEKVLVSVGRKPCFDVATTGFDITMDNGFIVVDEELKTSELNFYAIGDVTGKLMLAHTASKQGLYIADTLHHKLNSVKPHLKPINYTNIPACIFTNPEVASIGLREKQCEGMNIRIGKFPYAANGKALATGVPFGFVKTIINADTDEIVGMHIIGYMATELIAAASILISMRATVDDVANVVFAHPTISECIMESAEDTHKMAIHNV